MAFCAKTFAAFLSTDCIAQLANANMLAASCDESSSLCEIRSTRELSAILHAAIIRRDSSL